MHPLVARIHPSYRTAFLAWFVTRSLLWMATAVAGHSPIPALDAPGFAEGAPGWGFLVVAAESLDVAAGGWGAYGAGALALAALGELAMLGACVAVYRFVRREQLPQTADRATWLWAACPAMVWTLPATDWSFAVAGVAIALAALSASRHIGAGFALLVAMSFKPETILLWPGLALMGWKTYQPGKQHPISPWLTTLGPPAVFSALILLAMSLAGRFGVSLRTLQTGTQWRDSLAWHGLETHFAELVLGAVLVSGLVMAVQQFRQCPKSWPLLALPMLAWPFLHQPPTAAVAAVLLAVPFFAYLGKATGDPSLERPLLTASLGGLLVLVMC